jgi:hypothetical protein
MWATSHLVQTCYAYGYGKFGNCPTSRYIVLNHHTWSWLLTSNSKVWTRKLCLFATNNTNYFGSDYMMCCFTCAEGSTFRSVVVGEPRWSDMEGTCAQLCTMSFFQCGWPSWPIFSHGSYWPMMYVVWAIFWNHHYVDLWSMFLRLAHGMFHATSGGSASWQIMVLPLVHLIDLGS